MKNHPHFKFIRDFIKQHRLACLATVTTEGLPECSVVGFSESENMELYIGSYDSSRKAHNLKFNPKVALVIGWEGGQTVQYEGVAEEVPADKLQEVVEKHLEKMPTAAKYVRHQEEKFYKIKPVWVRYTEMAHDPWEIKELKFV